MSASRGSPRADDLLVFAHIGDLHITDAKQRNYTDFLAIVAQLETECAALLDFVILPGDNADNGLPEQYALVATALKMLSVPVHAIPGDHDMEQGGLANFYRGLAQPKLPRSLGLRGQRCLFLDFCGAGTGGPDFRLGATQVAWLETELRAARLAGETPVVFMHSYPDDLRDRDETQHVNRLLASYDVALVDMGHTHYNEIANDGGTIFAATRSTGQIEEGPVGCAFTTVADGVVSWRFKPLDDPYPLVMITAPADHRLMRGGGQAIDATCDVRAVVFGRRLLRSVECQVGDGPWRPMRRTENARHWAVTVPVGSDRLIDITVRATDETGRPGLHMIRAATPAYVPPTRARSGSDAGSIGAWPDNGIVGTQLGPNRNGKPSS